MNLLSFLKNDYCRRESVPSQTASRDARCGRITGVNLVIIVLTKRKLLFFSTAARRTPPAPATTHATQSHQSHKDSPERRASIKAACRSGLCVQYGITRPDWPANGLFSAFSRPLAEGWPSSAGRWPKILDSSVFTLVSIGASRYESREVSELMNYMPCCL